jgi:hypothetical protein
MKVLSNKRFKALVEKNGWPLARAEGSVDGGAMALALENTAVAGKLRFSNLETVPRTWSENCNGFSRAKVNGGDVKVLSKEKCQVVAERNGWSLERARGYVDGETFRLRAKRPSKYALIGIDEYGLGFRAGYYERRNGSSTVNLPGVSSTNTSAKA